jgi:hypothetical protein
MNLIPSQLNPLYTFTPYLLMTNLNIKEMLMVSTFGKTYKNLTPNLPNSRKSQEPSTKNGTDEQMENIIGDFECVGQSLRPVPIYIIQRRMVA